MGLRGREREIERNREKGTHIQFPASLFISVLKGKEMEDRDEKRTEESKSTSCEGDWLQKHVKDSSQNRNNRQTDREEDRRGEKLTLNRETKSAVTLTVSLSSCSMSFFLFLSCLFFFHRVSHPRYTRCTCLFPLILHWYSKSIASKADLPI